MPAWDNESVKATALAPVLAFALATAGQLAYSGGRLLTTKQKLDLIESDHAAPGSRILFPQSEINSYIVSEVPRVVPQGLREPKVQLAAGKAYGTALVDFSKLRHGDQDSLGWTLLGRLLEGERPVAVTAKVTSANGTATVELEKVQISGSAISGRPLRLLLEMFVYPLYPEAKVGEPFALQHGVDRIEVLPGLAQVLMKSRP
jgi:hypothetical protein